MKRYYIQDGNLSVIVEEHNADKALKLLSKVTGKDHSGASVAELVGSAVPCQSFVTLEEHAEKLAAKNENTSTEADASEDDQTSSELGAETGQSTPPNLQDEETSESESSDAEEVEVEEVESDESPEAEDADDGESEESEEEPEGDGSEGEGDE